MRKKIDIVVQAEAALAARERIRQDEYAVLESMLLSARNLEARIEADLKPYRDALDDALSIQRRTLAPWVRPEGAVGLYYYRYRVVGDPRFSAAWLRFMRHDSGKWEITLDALHAEDGPFKRVIVEGDRSDHMDLKAAADKILLDQGWQLQ